MNSKLLEQKTEKHEIQKHIQSRLHVQRAKLSDPNYLKSPHYCLSYLGREWR